jgi:hypothetical protein
VAGYCEHGNESSDSIKGGGEFLDLLSDCQLLKEALLHAVSVSRVIHCRF